MSKETRTLKTPYSDESHVSSNLRRRVPGVILSRKGYQFMISSAPSPIPFRWHGLGTEYIAADSLYRIYGRRKEERRLKTVSLCASESGAMARVRSLPRNRSWNIVSFSSARWFDVLFLPSRTIFVQCLLFSSC